MFVRSKVALVGVVLLVGSVTGAQAWAAQAQGPSAQPGAPAWPSYWDSVCGVASAGSAGCSAVQLLSPSQHWRGGPWDYGPSRSRGVGGSQSVAPPSAGYYPADLLSAYGLTGPSAAMSPGSGAPTVAIVDAYDDPDAASNLSAYRSAMSAAKSPTTGLTDTVVPPLCSTSVTSGCVTFTKVNESGGTSYPRANASWSEEISLDLDMVSAICPDCNIVLVEASSSSMSDLAAAVSEAKTFNPVAITNSYGGGESSSETAYNGVYQASAHTAITVATGDNGYGVEFPAASPYVTAVGGTSLAFAGSASSPSWSASVWADSGSGCSSVEAIPSWQTGSAYSNSNVCGRRQVADISADANPGTGVAAYDTYGASGWLVFGGTSVSAQIIGATYAVASSAGTLETSAQDLYVDSSGGTGPTPGLVPVTSGSNGSCGNTYLCNAADSLPSGYNGPSGLGTPYGLTAFVASAGGGTTTTSTSTTSTSTTSTSTTSTSTTSTSTTSTSTTSTSTTSTSTTSTSTTSTSTTSTSTTSTSTTTTAGPAIAVTVSAGAASRSGGEYVVPVSVVAVNSVSRAGISGASSLLDVYEGSSCSGTVAASGTFTTNSGGEVSVNFESRTAATWCLEATVTASGYTPGSGQKTFTT